MLLRDALLLHADEEVEQLREVAERIKAKEATTLEEIAAEVEQVVRRSGSGYGPLGEFELHLHASRYPELQEASRQCFQAYEGFVAVILEALGTPEPARHAPAMVALIIGSTIRALGAGESGVPGVADAVVTFLKGARVRTDSAPSSE